MLDILNKILCAIVAIPQYFLWAIVTALNAIIAAIAVVIGYALSLLPSMPDAPDWDGVPADVFGIVNWMFPLVVLAATIASMLVLWLSWQFIAIVLRWAKAV